MITESKIAAEVAKEIAREVYGDVFSPAAKVLGSALYDLANVMRSAGLEFGFISRERIIKIFEKAASRIPIERRTLPAPQILGPVLEGLRFEPEDTPVSIMFENLLCRSMNTLTSEIVHPSFPSIITRISSNEAIILELLTKDDLKGPWISCDRATNVPVSLVLPKELGISIEQTEFYVINLQALPLIRVCNEVRVDGGDILDSSKCFNRAFITLTPFGKHFMKACGRILDT